MMNITWKIGVNRKARKLIGSAPGLAGVSGAWGVAEAEASGPPDPEAAGPAAGAQAARTSTTRIRRSTGTTRCSRKRREITSLRASLADRVIATWVPGMTASDAPCSHPAPLEQAVLLDRLFRVARAGRLEPTAGWQPGEREPVEPDQSNPDALQPADPPSAPPLT